MKRVIRSLLLFCFIICPLDLSGKQVCARELLLLPHYFTTIGATFYGMGGIMVAISSHPSAIFNNPACLPGRLSGPTVVAEFGYISGAPWLRENIKTRAVGIKPQLIGITFPIERLTLGLGYAISSKAELDLGTHPYINGSISAIERASLEEFGGSLRFPISNSIQFGFALCRLYAEQEEYGVVQGSGDADGWRITVGGKLIPNDRLLVGARLRTGAVLSGRISQEFSYGGGMTGESELKGEIPLDLVVGISYNLTPILRVAGELEYIRWAPLASNYRDRANPHLGIEYVLVPEKVCIKAGFYTLFMPHDQETRKVFEELNNQLFLTLGQTLNIGPLALEISVQDSHLLTKGEIKQTLLNFGICMRSIK